MALKVENLSEIHKNIYFIQGKDRARYPYSNSLLLDDYIIDTGISGQYLRKLKRRHKINHVLLSHWHEDHISGNHFLPDAKFHCHFLDKHIIEDINKIAAFYKIEHEKVSEDLKKMFILFGMRDTPIKSGISDNEIIHIGDTIRLKILHTPGHTAGHCSFIELSSRVGFFGDIDLTNHPYYGNIDANLIDFERSIQRLIDLDFDSVVTGHRDPIYGKKFIKGKLKQYHKIILEREDAILQEFSELNRPINPFDLKNKNLIYKRYSLFKDFEILAEELMIEKHFYKLEFTNKINFEGKGYILA
ncbi:MAG: MBL fold metallo-hydrolase [Candidatus Lokiarchaeota archaeon]|jgi:glyoxylase-like metal-dependent hydrolase (beta-lactamase superfamily II)